MSFLINCCGKAGEVFFPCMMNLFKTYRHSEYEGHEGQRRKFLDIDMFKI